MVADRVRGYFRSVLNQWALRRKFPGSETYWERRYARGGDSGPGSKGRLKQFKAEMVNRLVHIHGIESVVELGCGDGEQLELIDVPEYVGVDVSASAIDKCRTRYAAVDGWRFLVAGEQEMPSADMALSMDVVLHLVEDHIFEDYLRELFSVGQRLVVIYSSNHEESEGLSPHNRHRVFTEWVGEHMTGWELTDFIAPPWPYDSADPRNTSDAAFHVYRPR